MKKVAVAERWSFVERWLCRIDCSFHFFNQTEKTPCLHEASKEQFGFPVHALLGWGSLSYLLGVKNEVLVALRVFSLKRSKAGAFAMPFRVLSGKKYDAGR